MTTGVAKPTFTDYCEAARRAHIYLKEATFRPGFFDENLVEISSHSKTYRVRESVLAHFKTAACALRQKDLTLSIKDGLRTNAAQERLFWHAMRFDTFVSLRLVESFSKLGIDIMSFILKQPTPKQRQILLRNMRVVSPYGEIYEYFSCLRGGPELPPAPHLTGGAIDVMLCDHQGIELDIGAPYQCSGQAKEIDFRSSKVSGVALSNRESLVCHMCAAGFAPSPHKIWHYEFGTHYWAVFNHYLKNMVDDPPPPHNLRAMYGLI